MTSMPMLVTTYPERTLTTWMSTLLVVGPAVVVQVVVVQVVVQGAAMNLRVVVGAT